MCFYLLSTALIHAVLCGQAAVCAYLVDRGADLTTTDNDGEYKVMRVFLLST